MALTASTLLTNVKRRAQLPDDGGTLSDVDILAMASDELQNVIWPRLLAAHEWHNAWSYTQALSSSREYRIHSRLSAQSIISIEYLDGSIYRFLRLVHPLRQTPTDGENYAVYGNKIVLSDAVATSGTIRIRGFLRPSRLVTTTGIVTGVAGSVITCAANTNLGTIDSNDGIDALYATSPYEMVEVGLAVSSSNATTVTLSATAPSTIVSGMLLNLGGEASRPQLPDELHDYLAQRTAIRCVEARGLKQDMDMHLQKLKDLESAFDRLVSPRVRGEFKAIIPEDFTLDRRY